jgi:DNA-binding MarR family transcriptional regulator
MRSEILDRVTEELLIIQPLIFRSIRKRFVKTALSDINLDVAPLHMEIMFLLERDGKLSVSEIGEKLQIARPQLTHYLDKLVQLKMVERQDGTDDRRIIFILLTDRGKNILKKQTLHLKKAFIETLDSLTDNELVDISNSLSKLRDLFSKQQ